MVALTGGRKLAWRGSERFLLCSTFKLPLAAQVLAAVDRGEERLDRPVPYGPEDLVAFSPVTAGRPGPLTVEALCAAAVVQSDNTAANLLLRERGGPAAWTAFLRRLGDPVSRLDRLEPALNLPEGDLDTSTPDALAATVRRLVLGDALAPGSRERLQGWLLATATGQARLRGGLPKGWRIAHKTGTGAAGAIRDAGVLYPPDGDPVVVVACHDGDPRVPLAVRERILAEVGRRVAAWAAPVRGTAAPEGRRSGR